jgi:hypothetical protein
MTNYAYLVFGMFIGGQVGAWSLAASMIGIVFGTPKQPEPVKLRLVHDAGPYRYRPIANTGRGRPHTWSA